MPATTPEKKSRFPLVLMSVLSFIKKLLQIFTIFLRYIWLMFPACLFLFAAYSCFWSLSQGSAWLLLGASVLLYMILNPLFDAAGKGLIKRGSEKTLIGLYWASLALFIIFIFLQYFVSRGFDFSIEKYRQHAIVIMVLTFI